MMLLPGIDRPYGGFSDAQKRAYVCRLMACGPFCRFLSPSAVNRIFFRLYADELRRAACAQRSEHTRPRRTFRSRVEDSSTRAMASITTPFSLKLRLETADSNGLGLPGTGGQIE